MLLLFVTKRAKLHNLLKWTFGRASHTVVYATYGVHTSCKEVGRVVVVRFRADRTDLQVDPFAILSVLYLVCLKVVLDIVVICIAN